MVPELIFAANYPADGTRPGWGTPFAGGDPAREQKESLDQIPNSAHAGSGPAKAWDPFFDCSTPATLLREGPGAALRSYNPTRINAIHAAYHVADNRRDLASSLIIVPFVA